MRIQKHTSKKERLKDKCEDTVVSRQEFVVPESIRHTVITLGHYDLGKHKMLARIASQFSWPNIFTDVTKFIRVCYLYRVSDDIWKESCTRKFFTICQSLTFFSCLEMDVGGALESSKNIHFSDL